MSLDSIEKEGIDLSDQKYMERAIELARKGEGFTNPNPMVGAVIVKDGQIIGEGYHEKCGMLHAERNAIASLIESADGATMYVTLEPCCHHGKTPPCTEAIIEQKIARVVIGSRDPNPKVAGKGVEILREAGITVVEDYMRDECDKLNPIFFHYIKTKKPYVIMKYAMTLDGKIATKTGASKWITAEESRREVQYMRHRYMGIMVGIGTVLADDPMLNTRVENLKSPVRIICDSKLRIPLDSQIVKSAKKQQTIIAYSDITYAEEKLKILQDVGIETVCCLGDDKRIDLNKLMSFIGNKGIDSILLEGGGTLNDSALRAGIVNEVQAFIAPKIFGGANSKSPVEGIGVEVPRDAVKLRCLEVQQIGEDIKIRYKVCMKEEEQCLQGL
jgi:riboflavin biosynthesis protein ribD